MVDVYISLMNRLPKEIKQIINEYSNVKLEYWREIIRELYLKYDKLFMEFKRFRHSNGYSGVKVIYHTFDFNDDNLIKTLITYKYIISKIIMPSIYELPNCAIRGGIESKLSSYSRKIYGDLYTGAKFAILAILLNGYIPSPNSYFDTCVFMAECIDYSKIMYDVEYAKVNNLIRWY